MTENEREESFLTVAEVAELPAAAAVIDVDAELPAPPGGDSDMEDIDEDVSVHFSFPFRVVDSPLHRINLPRKRFPTTSFLRKLSPKCLRTAKTRTRSVFSRTFDTV